MISPSSIVISGKLQRKYVFTIDGKPFSNVPGGNLLYASAGLGLWGMKAGLISNIAEDFPLEWVDRIKTHGFDISGIQQVENMKDSRVFIVNTENTILYNENPIMVFSKHNLNMPRSLLGYRPDSKLTEEVPNFAIDTRIQNVIPENLKDISHVIICANNYGYQSGIVNYFKNRNISNIVLRTDYSYMTPSFWDLIPDLINGLSVLICTEDSIRGLFRGRTNDINEMAETLSSFGSKIVVVCNPLNNHRLYNSTTKEHFIIPNYPSKAKDRSGILDSFSGGFLAGYIKTYDAAEAAIHACVSASIASECINPFHIFDTLPSLVHARADYLRNTVRKL